MRTRDPAEMHAVSITVATSPVRATSGARSRPSDKAPDSPRPFSLFCASSSSMRVSVAAKTLLKNGSTTPKTESIVVHVSSALDSSRSTSDFDRMRCALCEGRMARRSDEMASGRSSSLSERMASTTPRSTPSKPASASSGSGWGERSAVAAAAGARVAAGVGAEEKYQ